jgi:hypothetical protein
MHDKFQIKGFVRDFFLKQHDIFKDTIESHYNYKHK